MRSETFLGRHCKLRFEGQEELRGEIRYFTRWLRWQVQDESRDPMWVERSNKLRNPTVTCQRNEQVQRVKRFNVSIYIYNNKYFDYLNFSTPWSS